LGFIQFSIFYNSFSFSLFFFSSCFVVVIVITGFLYGEIRNRGKEKVVASFLALPLCPPNLLPSAPRVPHPYLRIPPLTPNLPQQSHPRFRKAHPAPSLRPFLARPQPTRHLHSRPFRPPHLRPAPQRLPRAPRNPGRDPRAPPRALFRPGPRVPGRGALDLGRVARHRGVRARGILGGGAGERDEMDGGGGGGRPGREWRGGRVVVDGRWVETHDACRSRGRDAVRAGGGRVYARVPSGEFFPGFFCRQRVALARSFMVLWGDI